MKGAKKWLGRFLALVLALYLLAAGGMYFGQRELLYHPDTQIGAPAEYGLAEAEELALTAEDGVKLQAWWLPPESAGAPVLVLFHGNAGNLARRKDKVRAYHEAGFGVLALSYRGYGRSEGAPSEQGIYRDAEAALAFLRDKMQIPPRRTVLYGESLGTGVAVEMAARHPEIRALVLEAPYGSIASVAQGRYPWLPVSPLLEDRFDSLAKIGKIRTPLLIFHHKEDPVVPFAEGKRLFTAAHPPKKAYWFPGAAHVDFDWPRLAAHMQAFLTRHPAESAALKK